MLKIITVSSYHAIFTQLLMNKFECILNKMGLPDNVAITSADIMWNEDKLITKFYCWIFTRNDLFYNVRTTLKEPLSVLSMSLVK